MNVNGDPTGSGRMRIRMKIRKSGRRKAEVGDGSDRTDGTYSSYGFED